MIIHSGNNALAYVGITSSLAPRQDARSTSVNIAAPARNAEHVSLSDAGKALAASTRTATQGRTPAQEKLIMGASSDRESAEKIAYDMANARSTIFYDISHVGGNEEVRRLSTSGREIDDKFKDEFDRQASAIDAGRRAIYASGKAKGTDPLQILSMMIDFTNSQSKDYLEASGWGWQGNSYPG